MRWDSLNDPNSMDMVEQTLNEWGVKDRGTYCFKIKTGATKSIPLSNWTGTTKLCAYL